MKHARLEIFLFKALLKGFIRLRHLALGTALAGFGFCNQLGTAGFKFSFSFTFALAQFGLDQHVVDDAGNTDAEGLFQIPRINDDLKISPEPLQITGVNLRGCLMFQKEILPILR